MRFHAERRRRSDECVTSIWRLFAFRFGDKWSVNNILSCFWVEFISFTILLFHRYIGCHVISWQLFGLSTCWIFSRNENNRGLERYISSMIFFFFFFLNFKVGFKKDFYYPAQALTQDLRLYYISFCFHQQWKKCDVYLQNSRFDRGCCALWRDLLSTLFFFFLIFIYRWKGSR